MRATRAITSVPRRTARPFQKTTPPGATAIPSDTVPRAQRTDDHECRACRRDRHQRGACPIDEYGDGRPPPARTPPPRRMRLRRWRPGRTPRPAPTDTNAPSVTTATNAAPAPADANAPGARPLRLPPTRRRRSATDTNAAPSTPAERRHRDECGARAYETTRSRRPPSATNAAPAVPDTSTTGDDQFAPPRRPPPPIIRATPTSRALPDDMRQVAQDATDPLREQAATTRRRRSTRPSSTSIPSRFTRGATSASSARNRASCRRR